MKSVAKMGGNLSSEQRVETGAGRAGAWEEARRASPWGSL
jgi:hypothetical protein